MTNTEFILRQKQGIDSSFKADELRAHAINGAIVLAFLAAFVGLVLLLAK
jgi:hypothetical protein